MILFALRGLTVSLSVFVLMYAVLRLSVAGGWSLTRQRFAWLSPNALYALQVGPFVLSVMIVAAFTVPSFLRFEKKMVPLRGIVNHCVRLLIFAGALLPCI